MEKKISMSSDLDENIAKLKKRMNDCGDFILRTMYVGEKQSVKIAVTYIDGMVNRDLIDGRIISPLLLTGRQVMPKIENVHDVFEFIKDSSIDTVDLKEITSIEDILDAILAGDSAMLIDGSNKALMIASKGWPNRGIQEPKVEAVIRGSSDGFTETIRMNTALIRRRIRDSRLKIKQKRVGERSQTDIAIIYIDDIVNKKVLSEVEDRIAKINIDAILESGYIEQLIEDDSNCLFPQIQNTQRPDEAVAAILEGRVVIVVDNSPFVLIAPTTFNSLLQTAEDYYDRWTTASILRFLRYLACFVAIGLPGLYIAIVSFQPDLIPVSLLLSIAATRQGVPFPAFLEAIFMELTVEVLREAGERLPGPIGQTIGIVGGLVIGQAAVSAGLVSPIMVIIVAFTAISSFAIPNYNVTAGIRITKFLLIIISAIFGVYGFMYGMLLLLIRLVKVKSFGVPYLNPFVAFEKGDIKDTFIRAPLKFMKKRSSLVYANKTRLQYVSEDDKNDSKR